jgi:hypothetical protein
MGSPFSQNLVGVSPSKGAEYRYLETTKPGAIKAKDSPPDKASREDAGIPLSAKPKTEPRYTKMEDVLAAISDRSLFGIYAPRYVVEKDKKYQPVTEALETIRSFLQGEKTLSQSIRNKLVAWLGNPQLLRDPVAHQARVNLIRALEKAPQQKETEQGIGSALETLKGNFGSSVSAAKPSRPTVSAEPPFKDRYELLTAISEANLFGDNLPAFENERNGKYFKVNISLYGIKEILQGNAVPLEFSKSKIVNWLSDPDLLVDLVAHGARVNLIKALKRTPRLDEDFNQAVKGLLDTLQAKYAPQAKPEANPTKANAEPVKEAAKVPEESPAPEKNPGKKEQKAKKSPQADKTPEEVTEAPPKASVTADADLKKEEKPPQVIPLLVFSYKNAPLIPPRKDNFQVMINKIKPILQNAYQELLRAHPGVSLNGKMFYRINNDTGRVEKFDFNDITFTGNAMAEDISLMLNKIADGINAQISFEKMGSDHANEVEWPLKMEAPKPKDPKTP